MKNYYKVLGVEENSDLRQIKKEYHRLATEYHPDKHQGKETLVEAENKFKEISEAYSILSDPNKKEEYDRTRKGGPFVFHTTGDPFDIFFRQQRGRVYDTQQQIRNQVFPGKDIIIDVSLPLVEALFGAEKHLEYTVESACEVCKGQGAVEFIPCQECNGTGSFAQRQPGIFIQSSCPRCMGTGTAAKERCGGCAGRRLVGEPRKISVRFPAKLLHDKTLRVQGGGGKGMNNGPSGDLYLKVAVEYPDIDKLTEEDRLWLLNILTKSIS